MIVPRLNWLSPRAVRAACLGMAVLGVAVQSGCVHRRATIVSDPPGATLLVEGEEVGQTPCSFDFTYYGTREFTLVKDGYETLTVLQPVTRPWYQVPPMEFVADNFGGKINDRRTFAYRLKPQVVPNTNDLLERASGVRSQAEVPR